MATGAINLALFIIVCVGILFVDNTTPRHRNDALATTTLY